MTDLVWPSRDDALVAAASEGLGGPAGRRIRPGSSRVMAVLLLLTTLVCALGLLAKQPCRAEAWTGDGIYPHLCYSDIAFLYRSRGEVDTGGSPYASPDATHEALEYPVGSGLVIGIVGWVTHVVAGDQNDTDRSRTFFDLTVLLLAACALASTWLIARTAGRRPWDAAMFALAPSLLLAAYINWDLPAVALTAGFGLAWARRRPVLAGVLLGLAIATKFYPLILLGPLFLLCLRSGQLRPFGRLLVATIASWLAINLPVRILWPEGWRRFYDMSQSREAGFGSPWYALDRTGFVIPGDQLNTVASGSFVVLCLGIAGLALFAPRRPRFWQLGFLVVAAFLITNKVYSPQYVLWLLALFPLARPRWRDWLIWQAGEITYFVAIWWHLQGLSHPDLGIPEWIHTDATFFRIGTTVWVCAMIVRDILRPEHDPIRADGSDDPAGGVLDGAPDLRYTPAQGELLSEDHLVEVGGRHADVDVDRTADGGHDHSIR